MDVLEMLLKNNNSKLPEKDYKVKRLSTECGEDVIFKIKALTYNQTHDIKMLNTDEMAVHIVLNGVIEPNFKDNRLLEKYSVPTPIELIKKILYPGEIEDLSRAIEILSGYRVDTIEEIKKK